MGRRRRPISQRSAGALCFQNSASILFRSFDQEFGSSRHSKQVAIATHQRICLPALREIETWLILCIPAHDAALPRDFHNLAERKIVGEKLLSLLGHQLELAALQNPHQFGNRIAGGERDASAVKPMGTQPP